MIEEAAAMLTAWKMKLPLILEVHEVASNSWNIMPLLTVGINEAAANCRNK